MLPNKSHRVALFRNVAVASCALLVTLLAWSMRPSHPGWRVPAKEIEGILWPAAHPIGPFQLQTQHGKPFAPTSFSGTWNFVFFGFLQCPDVCPTTLDRMRAFRRLLISANSAADQYQFVFVTVDPANDSPAAILSYLAFFDPAFLGLTGPESEISKLAHSLSAHYDRVVDAGGRTQFEHTTSVFVVDPQGRVVAALPSPHEPASMASMFTALRQHLDP